MNIIVNINENIIENQQPKIYNIGNVLTTIQDLLNNSTITITNYRIIILQFIDLDLSVKHAFLNLDDYSKGDQYGLGKDILASDLIYFSEGGNTVGGVQSVTGNIVNNTDPANPVINDVNQLWTGLGNNINNSNIGNVGIGVLVPTKKLEVLDSFQVETASNVPYFTVDSSGVYSSGNKTSYTGFSTAYGKNALLNNTVGDLNTAFGLDSLTANTSGTSNTALGLNALASNTSGSSNIAIGRNSLYSNTDKTQNTAIGNYAMFLTSLGEANTGVGFNTMYSCNGSYNTIIGNNSFKGVTTGLGSTGVGYRCLESSTGSYNTTLGYKSGIHLTTGSFNILLGNTYAPTIGGENSITTGNSNIVLSKKIENGITTGSNNVIIGTASSLLPSLSDTIIVNTGSGASRIYVDSTGNTGLGTTTPTSKLQVIGLPIYANNAAAIIAGLTAGAFFHNGDGIVRVVF